ncbi:cyclic nucleotide-binding protein [Nocardia nova]|uniref:FAD-dependent oxidoreductase n=1 Tax=Nocardia nova TaxID=37330 RepID=UPI000CEA2FCA|nr:FAD-dependent oxidoreductase [Nocardia nova]PPJ14408.1 cyclic nucleotide-binding protein [Nocardia nova]
MSPDGTEPPRETTDLHEAFPRLTDDQLAILESWGERRFCEAGQVLFRSGDRVDDVFVLLSGRVAIVEQGPAGDRVIQVHGERRFVGELGMLEGRPALYEARVVAAGDILAVPSEHLTDVSLQDSVLGETILRAYLIRLARLVTIGAGIRIIGSRYDPGTRRLLDFLTRNRFPHKWIDVDQNPDVESFLQKMNVGVEDMPVVVLRRGTLLRNPSVSALATALGLRTANLDDSVCDLLVVGAGPAGLAASVYGASDGLEVTTVDATAVGGQAGTTSRIENYLGFPAGISGAELTERALVQARRFGVRVVVPAAVNALSVDEGSFRAELHNDESVRARAIVVASGARYRHLNVLGMQRFETANVFYEATVNERKACDLEPVAVVGGGNSAGQAAAFLARSAAVVYLLIRDENLGAKMSRYLADQVSRNRRIEVLTHIEVRALHGDEFMTSIEVEDTRTGSRCALAARALFVFIGAQPQTAWLSDAVQLDDHGFVLTGSDLGPGNDRSPGTARRSILETSAAGIFAAGDVRRGATRRVAAAMGEGSIAVALVNEYLARAGHDNIQP